MSEKLTRDQRLFVEEWDRKVRAKIEDARRETREAMLAEEAPARALAIRLAWNLIADDSECTCYPGDECPLCHAKRVLGPDMPSDYTEEEAARG